MPISTAALNDLYSDTKTCAQLVGLNYVENDMPGISRIRRGRGFSYKRNDRLIEDRRLKMRIAKLVIPPAWQNVWICPDDKGHVLATGIDEKGRKQYIYHPKWRTMRDLIKFYRMITFAKALPKIRRTVHKNLTGTGLSRDQIIAAMLWILDNSYIRIGNDTYFEENESVGLTTLTDRNVVIAGPVVTLAFKGKSGKDQQITFENKQIAAIIDKLRQVKGARLFRYKDAGDHWQAIDSADINHYLHDLTGVPVSAKDFRTWGGTLMAFMHLIAARKSNTPQKADKVVVAAVDQAAAILGNTRAVAKSSYVHPHLLETYGSRHFARYYAAARRGRKLPGLDQKESELLHFLEALFEEEFSLLDAGRNAAAATS